ncbi:hypothetical protein FACS189428_4290 [Clostridia bacterium]|nr:hypothetical protein FACS189428_4290 [Clostridia bacterium]
MKKSFPHYRQLDAMDCGPTCLRMIAKHYGRTYSLQTLRGKSFITREGVSLLGISDAAESIGFHTTGVRIDFEQLANNVKLPCILHWNQNHFVVCYGIKRRGLRVKPAMTGDSSEDYAIKIADPAGEKYTMTKSGFLKCWLSSKTQGLDTGIALLLEPTPDFYTQEDNKQKQEKNLSYFLRYLFPFKSQIVQLAVGMLLGSVLALIFPFLTQAVVDQGISNNNLSLITLILIAQLVLSVTQMAVTFIQNWISLHVNARISISLISDFLTKLMKLPLRFFDAKNIGDIMQRIGDHSRIQSFMTGTTLSTLFSFFNFFVFAFILAYYSLPILAVFLAGNILYVAWILLFMRYRRKLDYSRFTQSSANQSNLVQLVTGMQEIKLNNCEKQQRWKWERIQVKLFKISIKGTALGQYQQIGSIFFNQTTTLLISFLSAKAVIDGDITLGMMMSISYIIGQLSGPIGQVIGFSQSLQDAKISLELLNEIHNKPDEATNALDANNERTIMDNLHAFYQGKTVVIVAHRLSTVQNADNIIVLEKGRIIEQGNHKELTKKKGAYYTLVKNQLELGVG